MVKNLIIIMLGGSLGAVCRYLIGLMAAKTWGVNFPWGTLIVNMAGCFLIGLIFALAESVRLLTPSVRLFLITGFLGALTTFSSFSLETTNAVRAGLTIQPIMNIMINNLGGFGLTFLGYWLGSLK
ncbi:MAG: fluoride efflux transporter CrcB [Desulfatiglans sp.]|nr:fluoride efflux transporter CrcB [Desulfatiglans sp.]